MNRFSLPLSSSTNEDYHNSYLTGLLRELNKISKHLEQCLTNSKFSMDIRCCNNFKAYYYILNIILLWNTPACDIHSVNETGPRSKMRGNWFPQIALSFISANNYSLVSSWCHPDKKWNLIALSHNLCGDISNNFLKHKNTPVLVHMTY